jgi:hypothetical protein
VSAVEKPQALCDPSQNGFFAEWPQRQRATFGLLDGLGNSLPCWSMTRTAPSITKGPFGRTRIVSGGDDGGSGEGDCDMRDAPEPCRGSELGKR